MAIIKPSPLVEAISGSIGGVTFAHGKGGTTARTRPRRRTSTTAPVLDQQARYLRALADWRDLSESDKNSWRLTAANITYPNALLGQKHLSAQALFLKQRASQTAPFTTRPSSPTPQVKTAPASSITLTFTSGGTKIIAFTEVTILNAALATVFGSRPFSEKPVNSFRYWKYIGEYITTIPPVDCTARWNAALGDPNPGETLGVRFVLWGVNEFPAVPYQATTTVL